VPNIQSHGENAAEIAVVMGRIARMVNLVVGRTQNEASPDPAKRDPELRMLKMADGPEKDDEQNVFAVDGEGLGMLVKQPFQNARRAADEKGEHVAKNDIVDGMVSEVR